MRNLKFKSVAIIQNERCFSLGTLIISCLPFIQLLHFFFLSAATKFMPSGGLAKNLYMRLHAGFWMV